MLKKETLSTLERLRDVHFQILEELYNNYNEQRILFEFKEKGKKALEECIEALDDVLCELRMMPEKKSESGTNSKEIVISFPAGFDLKAIRDAKLLVRYYKGNDEYSFLTETFVLHEKSKEEQNEIN